MNKKFFLLLLVLCVAMLVTMGIHSGPKERKVKPGLTTRAELLESFLAGATTRDGRFSIFSYHDWRDPGPFVPFGKAKHKNFGLMLIEFNRSDVVVRRVAHECGDRIEDTICEQPMEVALQFLIETHPPETEPAEYRLDDIIQCDLRSPLGFQVESAVHRQLCKPGEDSHVEFHRLD